MNAEQHTSPLNEWAPDEALELLVFIVNHGRGEAILQHLREHFDTGATLMPAYGTRPNKVLRFLALDEVRKDVLLLICPEARSTEMIRSVKQVFHLEKANSGIGFTIPLSEALGLHQQKERSAKLSIPDDKIHYVALCTILERGLGEEAVDVAREVGARGATVIEARGSARRISQDFAFEIEDQKDFLLMILRKEQLETVQKALSNHFSMAEANSGITFSYPLNKVIGLYGQED